MLSSVAPFELHTLYKLLRPAYEIWTEEDEKIKQRRDNRGAGRPAPDNEHENEHRRVKPSEPFDFNRQNKEEQKLEIGIKHREREKQRHVEVIVVRVSRNKSRDDCPDYAEQVIDIKLKRAPFALKRDTDKVVKIKREYYKYRIGARRQERKRYNTPNLTRQYVGALKYKRVVNGYPGKNEDMKKSAINTIPIAPIIIGMRLWIAYLPYLYSSLAR